MSSIAVAPRASGAAPISRRNANVWLGRTFFLACAFPFIGFPGVNFDVQPWALLTALAVLGLAAATRRLIFPRDLTLLLVASLLCVVLSAMDLVGERALRTPNLASAGRLMFGVASLPIIAITVYTLGYRLEKRLLMWVFGIWLVTACIQLADPSFGSVFLPRISTSVGRGVVSLAPEPDSFGRAVIGFAIMAFLLFLSGTMRRGTLFVLISAAVVEVAFLSRAASSAILMVIVGAAIFFASTRRAIGRVTMVISFALVVLIVTWAGLQLMADARVFMLLAALSKNPALWQAQGGFVLRVFNPSFSLQVGLLETLGRGVGIASTPTPGQVVTLWPMGVAMPLSDRAHGGLVGVVYSAGFVGLLYVVGFYQAVVHSLQRLSNASGLKVLAAGISAFSILAFFDQSLANGINAYAFGMLLLLARDARRLPAPVGVTA